MPISRSLQAIRRVSRANRKYWIVGGWIVGLAVAGAALHARYQIAKQRLDKKAEAEVRLSLAREALVVERAERAEAERELARSEADFFRERSTAIGDAILNSPNHGYAEVTHEGRVREWNLALTKMLGWTREEMLGRKITDIMMPEDRVKHDPEFRAYMADKTRWKQVVPVKCRAIHKDPNRPPVPISATVRALPTRENPNVPYSFAMIDLQSRVVEAEPPRQNAEQANQEEEP